MTILEKLDDLKSVQDFLAAAIYTPGGEAMAMLEGEIKNLNEIGVLANQVLMNSQKASLEMGAGKGEMVHVAAEKAHILVRCLNEGNDPLKSQPGKAHIHLVVVLKSDAGIGMARLKIDSVAKKLAEDFRD